MTDWTTIASLATAGGTLVLALATFASVRSANRSARLAEYSMQIGIRPLLMPSRLEDVAQKIMWGDEHWALLPAAGATVELVDGNVYLAMSLRNSGSGIGVIHGWHLGLHDPHTPHPHAEPDEFRPQLRDLYVPGGDIGFWRRRSGTRTIQSTPHSRRQFGHRGCSWSSCSTPMRRARSEPSPRSCSRRARSDGCARRSDIGTSIGPTLDEHLSRRRPISGTLSGVHPAGLDLRHAATTSRDPSHVSPFPGAACAVHRRALDAPEHRRSTGSEGTNCNEQRPSRKGSDAPPLRRSSSSASPNR